MQTGDRVQALGVPNKGIVLAFFVQATFLVPLVEGEYGIIYDDLAGVGFNLFDDESVALGLVIIRIFVGIAKG